MSTEQNMFKSTVVDQTQIRDTTKYSFYNSFVTDDS